MYVYIYIYMYTCMIAFSQSRLPLPTTSTNLILLLFFHFSNVSMQSSQNIYVLCRAEISPKNLPFSTFPDLSPFSPTHNTNTMYIFTSIYFKKKYSSFIIHFFGRLFLHSIHLEKKFAITTLYIITISQLTWKIK